MQESWSQIIRTSFSASLAAKIAFATLRMRTKWYLLMHRVQQKGFSIPFPSIIFLVDPPQKGPEWAQKKRSGWQRKKRSVLPALLTILPVSPYQWCVLHDLEKPGHTDVAAGKESRNWWFSASWDTVTVMDGHHISWHYFPLFHVDVANQEES